MPGTAPSTGDSEKGKTGTVSAHLELTVCISQFFPTPGLPASAPALPGSPTDHP